MFKKWDNALNTITNEIVKIFSYNDKFWNYKVQNNKWHFSQVDEEVLEEINNPIKLDPIILKQSETQEKPKLKDEIIANKYLIITLLTFFVIITLWIFFSKEETKPIKQKSQIELLNEEILKLELSNTPEFELQKKSMKIYNDSVDRVKKTDLKIQNKRLEIYNLIK